MSKNIIINGKRYLEKIYLVRYGKEEVTNNPNKN